MALQAVLRVDVLARETPIPIVPYAKLGLGSAIWLGVIYMHDWTKYK